MLNNPLYYLYCIVFFQYHKSPIIGVKYTNLDLSPELIIANIFPTLITVYNSNTIIILHLVDQNTYQVLHLIKDKLIKNTSKKRFYYKFKKGKMIKIKR